MNKQVVVCRTCGLGVLYPQPGGVEIASYYPPEYYGHIGEKFESAVEWLVRLVAARQVRFLARQLPTGARVLDIGCGRGVLLKALADRGLEVHGVEMSRDATVGADPRVPIRIAGHLCEADYPAEFFDRVILWHVFEHLADPRGTLAEIRRILNRSGEVVIAVPNFSSWQARWSGAAWFHLDLPRHLHHFPIAALRQLLSNAGFECCGEHHFSLRQNPFGWVQSALNRTRLFPRNALYTLLHRRENSCAAPFSLGTRTLLRAAYLLGMPAALVLSVIEALARSGATMHVIARKNVEPTTGVE